ncbi:MAG: transferrin receptor-like dimerization domain-containing protein [bacterium]
MRLALCVYLAFIVQLATSQPTSTTQELEATFRSFPKPENIRSYVQKMSVRPHHVGTAYTREIVDWMKATITQWGLNARVDTFEVLFPTPKERIVELVEPTRFKAKLQEPIVTKDQTSVHQNEQLPTYNAYSIDGDVMAPLVYVNYGITEDYQQLERLGISVKGCIVIARYGASWRGIKPKLAAEHGAVGCIIYSDPRDDGYFQGDMFPDGPFRPRDGVQRGSVMDMPLYPGDPLTPGIGATAGAQRLDLKEVKTLTRIPVLPISFADAQPLLAALTGPVAPESWRGALPITYHIGVGPAKVRLKVNSNWELKKIYDVITTIPGSVFPNEWILRGNHHDAWVYGTQDPVSGVAAMLEELHSYSELIKRGWKPKRTIIYGAWDGEEPGLLGSTEWAEAHADELRQKAVLYINTDSNGRGFLGMSGSHLLERFMNAVAKDIEDPEKKISVHQRARHLRLAQAQSTEERAEIRQRADLRIGALGSGSDYTVFFDHLGIASLNLGYGGEDEGGIYHSIYDDLFWYQNFSDAGYSYGCTLAQTVGTAVLRAADAELLPFHFTNFLETVRRYQEELKRLLKSMQDQIHERNTQLQEGVFSSIADPKEVSVPPSFEELPPHLNFSPLENSIDALARSVEQLEKRLSRNDHLSVEKIRTINRKLLQAERVLTHPDGLIGRPWFKHMIYAPGFYTGYGVKTLPGIREAIEQKRWSEAEQEISRVALVLNNEAGLINSIADELEK